MYLWQKQKIINNKNMKKLILVLIILILIILPAFSTYARDKDIGILSDIIKDSNESKVLDFFFSEFSLSSLESHVKAEYHKSFSNQYGSSLASVLPLNEALVSIGDGVLHIKDRTKNVIFDVFYDDEGVITSLSIRR